MKLITVISAVLIIMLPYCTKMPQVEEVMIDMHENSRSMDCPCQLQHDNSVHLVIDSVAEFHPDVQYFFITDTIKEWIEYPEGRLDTSFKICSGG